MTVTATDDARQRCLLEAKRKILEQAGVYIESASEVKNFDLTKDKIASFAAADDANTQARRAVNVGRVMRWTLVKTTKRAK